MIVIKVANGVLHRISGVIDVLYGAALDAAHFRIVFFPIQIGMRFVQ